MGGDPGNLMSGDVVKALHEGQYYNAKVIAKGQ